VRADPWLGASKPRNEDCCGNRRGTLGPEREFTTRPVTSCRHRDDVILSGLQPVFVEDVAEAIARILADPATTGRTYELAGPKVYTMRELVMIVLRIIGIRRALVSVPFAVAQLQARLLGLLPNPPLTTGQVDLLKVDNVAGGTLPGLRELNIMPKAVEEIVPTYLGSAHKMEEVVR